MRIILLKIINQYSRKYNLHDLQTEICSPAYNHCLFPRMQPPMLLSSIPASLFFSRSLPTHSILLWFSEPKSRKLEISIANDARASRPTCYRYLPPGCKLANTRTNLIAYLRIFHAIKLALSSHIVNILLSKINDLWPRSKSNLLKR